MIHITVICDRLKSSIDLTEKESVPNSSPNLLTSRKINLF